MVPNHLAMYAIANDIKTPTLVELQMLLGMAGNYTLTYLIFNIL